MELGSAPVRMAEMLINNPAARTEGVHPRTEAGPRPRARSESQPLRGSGPAAAAASGGYPAHGAPLTGDPALSHRAAAGTATGLQAATGGRGPQDPLLIHR